MPEHVRFVYKLLDGRFHVYTSPDVKGLHASADTKAEAQRAAIAMVDFYAERDGTRTPFIEFTEPLAQAA